MATDSIDVGSLYERGTTVREDMRDHPRMKAHKPHPVGIAGSTVEQFNGTNIFQWWVHCRDARWRHHGPLVMIDDEAPNVELTGAAQLYRAASSERSERG